MSRILLGSKRLHKSWPNFGDHLTSGGDDRFRPASAEFGRVRPILGRLGNGMILTPARFLSNIAYSYKHTSASQSFSLAIFRIPNWPKHSPVCSRDARGDLFDKHKGRGERGEEEVTSQSGVSGGSSRESLCEADGGWSTAGPRSDGQSLA